MTKVKQFLNDKALQKIAFFCVVIFLSLFFFRSFSGPSNIALNNDEERGFSDDFNYYKGIVLEIESEKTEQYLEQIIKAGITSGERKGEEVMIEHRSIMDVDESYRFKEGDRVVLLSKKDAYYQEVFYIGDHDRTGGLVIISLIFLTVILFFGRERGLGALLGLGFSAIVLVYYMIPNIIAGNNPMQVILFGAVLISSISLFLAHGFKKRTILVWGSTVITLIVSILLTYFFVDIASLFGRGSEAAMTFQLGDYSYISLRGLLLAGMVVGVLGILSDVTSTQTAVIWELKKANKDYGFADLYKKSLNVGKEHIASLVNTLVLVYAGASLPLFILIYSTKYTPLWVTINSEHIAEEIARAFIGSSSLIIAVPIASLLASYFIGKMKTEEMK